MNSFSGRPVNFTVGKEMHKGKILQFIAHQEGSTFGYSSPFAIIERDNGLIISIAISRVQFIDVKCEDKHESIKNQKDC